MEDGFDTLAEIGATGLIVVSRLEGRTIERYGAFVLLGEPASGNPRRSRHGRIGLDGWRVDVGYPEDRDRLNGYEGLTW